MSAPGILLPSQRLQALVKGTVSHSAWSVQDQHEQSVFPVMRDGGEEGRHELAPEVNEFVL